MAVAQTRNDVELVTVDSMQVYKGMTIGTAKPTVIEQTQIRHHLLDVCGAEEDYTVARFQRDCLAALADIEARGKRAILVGGTGLYLQAVTDDLELPGRYPEVRAQLETEPDTGSLYSRLEHADPLAASRMEPTNRRRVVRALEVTIGSGRPFSSFGPGLEDYPDAPFAIFGLDIDRTILDRRIADRYEQQMADGFLAEVASLRASPLGMSRTARQALGYAELLDHLEHGTALDEAVATAVTRTRRFARRQQRWFGRDPRVHWIATDGKVSPNLVAELASGLVD